MPLPCVFSAGPFRGQHPSPLTETYGDGVPAEQYKWLSTALSTLLRHYTEEDVRIAERGRALGDYVGLACGSRTEGIHRRTRCSVARVGPYREDMRSICHSRDVVAQELCCQAVGAGTIWIGSSCADL